MTSHQPKKLRQAIVACVRPVKVIAWAVQGHQHGGPQQAEEEVGRQPGQVGRAVGELEPKGQFDKLVEQTHGASDER